VDFTQETLADAVVASFADTPDARLKEVLSSFTRHLHAFVREVQPSTAEWERAVEFLTAVGQACTETRQEVILLSDVLGVSTLVETLGGSDEQATASTVLGPFHMVDSPPRELGASIATVGEPSCLIEGQVTDPDGTPLAGAGVDVWQADEHGYYDVQVPDSQPVGNLRGLFTTDGEGRFWFRTVVPSYYPIPTDGPVGELLAATRRHCYRPAHVHFIATADGHRPVTTHAFVAGSPYIDSDAVFAAKESLIREFETVDDPKQAARLGLPPEFHRARFDIVLPREEQP
jgi:protocatechuate 3,4-dioxygenase beta subunit